MYTYIAINELNGKFYIGSSVDVERRKIEHLQSNVNLPFQNALRKNPDKFEWQIYEDDCDEPILEQVLLDIWCGKSQCYNINPYASRPPDLTGRPVAEETRIKISNKMKGREINDKTREAVSKSNKNRVISEETLIKKSKAVTGDKNPFYGKKHTEETIQKFKASRKGMTWWYNTKTDKTCLSKECPGSEWIPGRKPKS